MNEHDGNEFEDAGGLGFDFDFFGVKKADPTSPAAGAVQGAVAGGVGFLDPVSAIIGGVGGAAASFFNAKASEKAGKDAIKIQKLQTAAQQQADAAAANRSSNNAMTIASVGVLALAGLLVYGIVRRKN